MANLGSFSALLMYLCSAHDLLSLGNFQSPSMPLPSHSWSAQLSGGWPFLPLHAGTQTIFQTPQQHTNIFQKSTSTRSPSSPHLLSRWSAMAKCSRAITSEEEPSLVMLSSFYTIDGGTDTFTTTSQLSFFGRNLTSAQR